MANVNVNKKNRNVSRPNSKTGKPESMIQIPPSAASKIKSKQKMLQIRTYEEGKTMFDNKSIRQSGLSMIFSVQSRII